MHYAVYCTDAEGSGPLRKEHMEAHLAHIENIGDKLMLAGPCPPDAENERGASFLVLEAESFAEARQIMESDPYSKAGIWNSITVREFKATVGQWAPARPVAAATTAATAAATAGATTGE